MSSPGQLTIDLMGRVFRRLTVVALAGYNPRGRNGYAATWLCRCECGREKIVAGIDLRAGRVVSCGCARGGYRLRRQATVRGLA